MDALARRHAPHEDVLAILIGTLLVSLGIVIDAKARLLTGGIAGLALLITYVTPVGFWLGYSVLNLPFYWLAWRRKGRAFVVRTVLAVTLQCGLTQGGMVWLDVAAIEPTYASIVGGVLIGIGLLSLFRHGTTLGGMGILAVYLQERHGLRAGFVQMAFDALLLLAATTQLPAGNLIHSVVGAAVINGVLAVYHRADRYVGIT